MVQTKVPGRDHAYDRAIASVEGSLERLGLAAEMLAVGQAGGVAMRGQA